MDDQGKKTLIQHINCLRCDMATNGDEWVAFSREIGKLTEEAKWNMWHQKLETISESNRPGVQC